MKKIFLTLICLLLATNLILASSVTRSFSKTTLNPGESFSVTLNVVVGSGENFYLIDEILPSTAWIITNNGGLDTTQAGHLKFGCINGLGCTPTSTSYTYTLTAPTTPGVYTFSGTYGFESLDSTTPTIFGANQVTISGSSSPTILINEFESNPISGNEWIELYNPNSFSVNLSNWKLYDGLSSPSLIKTLSLTMNANSYYVYELTSTKLNNANEFITLKDSLNNTIDETATLANNNADSKSWQRIPNGIDTNSDGDWQFLENTRGYANSVTPPPVQANSTDDLMVNYVRGKINIGTEVAPAGTTFTIEILDGVNRGYRYLGIVDDSKIYSSLRGNGYFDTSDQIGFNTGARFRINVTSERRCTANGTFQNGGNGNFNTLEGLIIINCERNVAPVLNAIGDKVVNEGEELIIQLSATDQNHDALRYYKDATFGTLNLTNGLFKWTPNYTSAGNYEINFSVSDGEFSDSETINVEVINKPVAPVITQFEP